MMRIAVRFAYLGDGFSGSQVQPDTRTVEGEMRRAIRQVCGMDDSEFDIRLASRTDKGVNALGNVAVFYTGFDDPGDLLRALNAVSDGVFYTSYAIVGEDFNPRYASSREYRYIMPSKGLDIGLVRECASLFVGEHDFARFCRPDGKPTVATVDSIEAEEDGDSVVLTYRARFFLWNMVRRTAAAIMSVASERSCLDDVRRALDGEEINFGIARADALTLTDVSYTDVTFVPCGSPVLSEKAGEGELSARLRLDFYRGLQRF